MHLINTFSRASDDYNEKQRSKLKQCVQIAKAVNCNSNERAFAPIECDYRVRALLVFTI